MQAETDIPRLQLLLDKHKLMLQALYLGYLPSVQHTLVKYRPIYNNWTESQKAYSPLFNLFSVLGLGETRHSRVLSFLLNPRESHGQGPLYLHKFLSKLDIVEHTKGVWQVFTESNNVDVLLKREYPHTVIVIENKSNWAVDQTNQLYRYFEQQIWPYIQQGATNAADKLHFRIIYLAPVTSKRWETHSVSRPITSATHLPEAVPEELLVRWSFDKHICEWLEDCLKATPQTNVQMQTFIGQYLAYWKS